MIDDPTVPRGTSPPPVGVSETDLSEWLPIADAASRIGCSTRTVERLAAAKKLEQRLRPQDGTPPVAVYNPEDVARIASERRPDPAPFVLDAVRTPPNGNGHGRSAELTKSSFVNFDEARAAMVAVVTDLARGLHANLSPPSPTVAETVAATPTLYLTVGQAATLLNWTTRDVRAAVKSGELPCRNKAKHDWHTWRIKRTDVEAL